MEAPRSTPPSKKSALKAQKTLDDKRKKNPYLRAENEDDDGYDPYSDRPCPVEPLFQKDPWR